MLRETLWQEGTTDVPISSSQLGLHSHWGTGASQFILRFLTNEIGLCIVELVYAGEEGSGSFRLLFLLIKKSAVT